MRYVDSMIEPYIDGRIRIEHDEEYYYRKWWESYREEMVYVYTADKKEVFLGNVDADIFFKYDNDVEGYFVVCQKVNTESLGRLKLYDRYIELEEFAMQDNELFKVKALFDYLFYYARTKACPWIYISKKEEFFEFYQFIRDNYSDLIIESPSAFLLRVDNVVEYEDVKHLTPYVFDKLSMEDIYYLHLMMYNVQEKVCTAKLLDDNITIDRADGLITFPTSIKASFTHFGVHAYPLIGYIARNYALIKKNGLTYNQELSSNFDVYNLGNDQLIVFDEIQKDGKKYVEFLKELKNKTNVDALTIFNTKFSIDNLNWFAKVERISISKELAKIRG